MGAACRGRFGLLGSLATFGGPLLVGLDRNHAAHVTRREKSRLIRSAAGGFGYCLGRLSVRQLVHLMLRRKGTGTSQGVEIGRRFRGRQVEAPPTTVAAMIRSGVRASAVPAIHQIL